MPTDPVIAFAAFLITAASLVLWFRGVRRVALPADRSGFVAAWALAAGLGVWSLVGSPGWVGGALAGLATLAALLLLLTVAISAQKVGEDAISVGMPMPHFTALTEEGAAFDSASLAGDPLLLKFFRGHW